MGKSNKFDYTNRPNSGAKLGQIIGSALQKEAEKVQKDAERLLQKARKQSTDSGSGGSDSNPLVHVVDLKVPNKDLTDDGVCALIDGLEIALNSGTSQASLALEDLNLSGNGISTVSLARLAPVIKLARYDLKTLNLADNKIQVRSDEEAAQWEAFLISFKNCMKLRRLDLSTNSELGARSMDVFARVHIAELPINPIPACGATSTLSLITEHDDDQQIEPTEDADAHNDLQISFHPGMTGGRMMKRRCGLRSIPYITLNDIGLDDAGALWLSYVLEDHYYPNQLIDEVNATRSDSVISTYQQDASFRGMDWADNKTLGKEGRQLLEKTEAFRHQVMLDDKIATQASVVSDADSGIEDGSSSRRASLEQESAKSKSTSRRVSVRSIRTADGGEHEATELESIRKKLKRFIIAHDGASSVELWRSALKIFRASRILLCLSPTTRQHYTGLALFHIPKTRSLAPTSNPAKNDDAKLQIETMQSSSQLSPSRPSVSSKVVKSNSNSSSGSDGALTEVTNTPVTPMILQRPTQRKGAFSEDTDYFQKATEGLGDLKIGRDQKPWGQHALHCIRFQQDRLAEAKSQGREFRDTSMPCNLPGDIIEHVAGFLMTDRELSVMSGAQQRAAIRWGQDRGTLMTERDWVKKDESTQVLMLLDSISCLVYQH